MAVRGMISFWPAPLRQLLEGSAKSGSSDSVLSARDNRELSAEQASLRKDALLGHLLKLVARGPEEEALVPPHALPALSSQLVTAGLLPRCRPAAHCGRETFDILVFVQSKLLGHI